MAAGDILAAFGNTKLDQQLYSKGTGKQIENQSDRFAKYANLTDTDLASFSDANKAARMSPAAMGWFYPVWGRWQR